MRDTKDNYSVPEVEISYKPTKHSVRVTGSHTANKIFRQIWDRQLLYVQEQFYVLFLNQSNDVLCWRLMNTGSHSRCIVDHKLLVAIVCKTLTQSIIIAHNHPSGSLQPSDADKLLTRKMQEILKPFDVHVLDHLIINGNDYFSFADEDLIVNNQVH